MTQKFFNGGNMKKEDYKNVWVYIENRKGKRKKSWFRVVKTREENSRCFATGTDSSGYWA